MPKRALFVFDWQRLTEQHFRFVEDQAARYDELIFLIDRPDERMAPAMAVKQLSCGSLLELLNGTLSTRLNKPFYILPVAGKALPNLYYWLRCKMLCPPIEQVYIDQQDLLAPILSILKTPVEIVEIVNAGSGRSLFMEDIIKEILFHRSHRKGLVGWLNQTGENFAEPGEASDDWKPTSRGLFITRAQPWHLGHAAFIEQMKEEVEEVIVVLAMANKSHQPTDIATAGERMEMVLPWLHENLPGRFYLVPMPYSDFTMENIYELAYLLPSFQQVYTSNPTIEAMAVTAGYAIRSLQKPIAASGTMIRDCIRNDQPYQEHLPETIYHYLQGSAIPERLKKIHERENRLE